MPSRQQVLDREQRWAKPVGLASLAGVVLLIASTVVGAAVHGEGQAALLRSAHAHASSVTFAGVLSAIAFLLLALPLVYLFRADQARSPRVAGGMIGLCVLAPLCLGISSAVGAAARSEAADSFVSGGSKPTLTAREASRECASDRKDKGAKDFAGEYEVRRGETALAACERRKLEDDAAENATSDASLASAAGLFGIVGAFSLIVALFYVSLWAMRTGLLGRFWASLGMALGITVILGIILFALLWFAYLGLLIAGWVPGSRPAAWEEGEAVPWPTPGERAAAGIEAGGEPADQAEPPTPEEETPSEEERERPS